MITAVILTHNSESTLKTTLNSLTWCDEIILIDDSSEDRTRDIAKKYTSQIYVRHLCGDFADQRNFALKKAHGDWVLFVDSDEVVSGKLQQEIRKVIENPNISGYFVKRLDKMYGKYLTHGETGSVALLRLGKRERGSWIHPIHEVWDIQGPKAFLKESLHHFPHQNVAQFISNINMYSSLYAGYLYKQKIHEPIWYVVVYPVGKFIQNYIWRLGFLDGMPGLILAVVMSFHSFLVRAKLLMLWKTHEDST